MSQRQMNIRQKLNQWRKSLSTKSTLAVIITAGVLMELTSAIQYWYAREGIRQEVEQRAESELRVKNLEIEKILSSVEATANTTVWMIEQQLSTPDKLPTVMKHMIEGAPNIMGCGIGFLPNYYPSKGQWFEPYVVEREDGSLEHLQIGSERHNYHQADWYAIPMKTNKSYWTEPYFDDAGGKKLMITYSRPIHDAQGRTVAVFGADVALDWLQKVLNEHHLYPSSYNLMISRTGQLMACPTESLIMQKSIHEATANLTDTSVRNVNRQIMDGQTGQATITDENGEKNYVFFAPIGRDSLLNNGEQLGWSMVVVCSDDEIYKGLRQVGTGMLVLMLVGLALLAYILSRTVKGFQKLQTVNLEKERVVRELSLSRNIQMAMLPKLYTPTSQDDIDMHALLTPARQVGGDFYDYNMSDDKLIFCIGDVSGKGIPAAIVMAMARSIFQMLAAQENTPDNIVKLMNKEMTRDNEYNIFITLFVGVLDLHTGTLRYCNAGHKAPWILRPSDGETSTNDSTPSLSATLLPMKAHLPIGAMPDWEYVAEESAIPPGSFIFLYTDGLTEAENADHEEFGVERTRQVLSKLPAGGTCKQLIHDMTEAVTHFVGDTEQSDDLTLFAIRYGRSQ